MSESKPLRGPFPVPGPEERPPKQIARLDVNGSPREVAVRPYDVLLDTLREDLGLTGTTRGCDMGTCGCCTVHVDGEPVPCGLSVVETGKVRFQFRGPPGEHHLAVAARTPASPTGKIRSRRMVLLCGKMTVSATS